jgi:hypothetical protein
MRDDDNDDDGGKGRVAVDNDDGQTNGRTRQFALRIQTL